MRSLLNLLSDNRGRGAGLRADVSGDVATVWLYDAIGWFGIEAGPFVKEIAGIKAKSIDLRINSPGGDVFDARAMKTALDAFDGKVTAYIDGLSASAATFLMMAADEIVISDGAFVMVHNAWGLTMGNAEEHRAMAGVLDKVDDAIVADYRKKTGKAEAELRAMMAAETWFTAEEALSAGFVDRIAGKDDGADAKAASRWNLSAYAKAPAALIAPADATEDPIVRLGADRDRYMARLSLYERTA